MISDFCHSWSPTLFFCLKKSIPLSIKAQMKDQKLKSPRSIERNLNRSTNGSRARKCHTNIFPSFDLFCWKSLSYSHFVRCSNTAMMKQCFGNMKQDQIWWYDVMMIQGHRAMIYSNERTALLDVHWLEEGVGFQEGKYCELARKFDSQKTTEISVPKRNS